jgi:predicted dehydrogenase
MKDYRMPEVGFEIEGSRGILEVNDDRVRYALQNGERRTWFRHDLNDNVPFWLASPEYFREDKYFIDCVLQKAKAEPSFESASKVDKMIAEVRKNCGMSD